MLQGRTMRGASHHVAMFLSTAVVVVCALVLSAASSRAADKIRIGVLQTSGAGPMYIALERGYFKAEGLDAEIVTFDNAQSLAVSIASQELEFGATSLSAGFYNLAAQNLLRIIAAQGRDNPGFPNNGVVASNEAWEKGLRSLKDLGGHVVGVTTLGSAPHYCVGLLADKYRFDLASVDLQTLKTNPNLVATVASNRVDAAVTPSTFALSMVKNGQAHLLGWIGDETPWQLGAAYTSTKIADTKGEMVKRFLSAYVRGMHDYYDAFTTPDGQRKDGATADAVLAILSKSLNQPAELLRSGISFVDREARIDAKDIRHQIDWYKAQGLYQGTVDADQLLDRRYAVLLP